MKTVVLVVLALLVGAGSGAFIAHDRLEAEVLAAKKDHAAVVSELTRQFEEACERAERASVWAQNLEVTNQRLEQRLSKQKSGSPSSAAVQTGSPKTTSAPVSLASLAGMTDPKKGTPANNASVAAGEGDENQRRQNARERMRERMDTFFDEEYEKAADPEVQQRLEQMEQYIEQMGELRRAMRNASPDKRAELREQMGETVAALRDIGEAQQDYMLRDLARQYNISDPHDQDAFVSSFRELQSSPFFRPENLVWGNARRAFRNAAQK